MTNRQLQRTIEGVATSDGAGVKLRRSLGSVRVSELMVKQPCTADPHMDVMELRRIMLEHHARYVPVMDGTTLMGVVSFHDVAKAVYEEQSFENRMLKGYIKNWPEEESSSQ